ncbi:MAG: EAL domain-containing protein [Sphaerochaetaceae bacterium]
MELRVTSENVLPKSHKRHIGVEPHQDIVLEAMLSQSPVGIVISKTSQVEGAVVNVLSYVNPRFETMLGRSKEEIVELNWEKLTHPEDLELEKPLYEQLLKGAIPSYTLQKRYQQKDGTYVWTLVTVAAIKFPQNPIYNHVAIIQDISTQIALQQTLTRAEESQNTLLSNLPAMVYRCNRDKMLTITYLSDGCYELTGYTAKDILEQTHISYYAIIAAEYRDMVVAKSKEQLDKTGEIRLEYEIITADKKRKWVLEVGRKIPFSENEVEGFIIDISRNKELEYSLLYCTTYNNITGLPNDTALETRLNDEAVKRVQGERALLAVNCTSLYAVSLMFGQQYVEQIIQKIATSLAQISSDTIELYGSFENRFILYVNTYKRKEELFLFCQTVIRRVDAILAMERVSWGLGVLEIDWSIPTDPKEALNKVYLASEQAIDFKTATPNLRFYDQSMSQSVIRERTILTALTRVEQGFETEQLFVMYQPIVSLTTSAIMHFEALARFNCYELGPIAPSEFIGIAEKYKVIIPLGWLLIAKSLEFLHTLSQSGHSEVGVSINISAFQLLEPSFVETLSALVKEKGMRSSLITLELTETGINSTFQKVNEILGSLQQKGFKIAIDDFGTGHSSFARESILNVNCLKLDKLFIDQLLVLDPHQTIVKDLVSMAHKLGHQVIAEGVEHPLQHDYLKHCGCDMGQGYLYSKPLLPTLALQSLSKQANPLDPF